MVNTNDLFNKVFDKSLNQIYDWNYNDVIGENLYKKYTGHYAFVKLKISKNTDTLNHEFINKLTLTELPLEFVNEIKNTLFDFIAFLKQLKNDVPFLKIEIIDGTYHPIDSKKSSFKIATCNAIKNAFDRSYLPISDKDLKSIVNCKTNNNH